MKPVALSAVDVSVHIKIIDATDGSPETGVTSATAGLALSYRKGQTGALTALTESDLATVATAHADGGMIHTNAGVYRVDLPDAAVPTTEGEETWVTGVVTGMQVIPAAIIGRVVPLAPTTAGRTLDVSAGGEAGIDWANVGSPTTTVGLSGTTVKTATDVETDTADIQGRIPAALVSGRIDASVGAMASGVLTATAIAADAITDAKVASDVTIASVTGAVGSVTGNVGGNVVGSVGSVTGAVGSVAAGGITSASFGAGAIDAAAIAANAIGASELAADAVAEIADGVWDEAISGHLTAGTTGAALSAAGSAGDPWSSALPGAYASGTAGNIIGNIASTVWDRLTSALTTSGSIGAYIASKLGGTTITVTAPVAAGGNVTVYIGDDYNNTDSRALDWSSASWPNLTSATIALTALGARTTGADWTLTGTAPTAGVGSQTVRFQPTAAETALLREGSGHRFQIEATLSSGRVVTLVDATLTALRDIA